MSIWSSGFGQKPTVDGTVQIVDNRTTSTRPLSTFKATCAKIRAGASIHFRSARK
ncbi:MULTISPECIES: hypothetical protein [Burkholderia]|uniref:hypothetical protein n=1 Tax=Burkholderia TaxID=32008 RepID=UPI0015C63EAE|nr:MULTISPECIES: hypothetical protein [Burkholderia]